MFLSAALIWSCSLGKDVELVGRRRRYNSLFWKGSERASGCALDSFLRLDLDLAIGARLVCSRISRHAGLVRLRAFWLSFIPITVNCLGPTFAPFFSLSAPNSSYQLHILTGGLHRYTHRYILGSGGTLLFDVTIVAQSFLYKGRKPLVHGHHSLSASGYLPPRSVGVSSVGGSSILGYGRAVSRSRTGTIGRSGTLGRGGGPGRGSLSRQRAIGSIVERVLDEGKGKERGLSKGGEERERLLPAVQQQNKKDYGASSFSSSGTLTP